MNRLSGEKLCSWCTSASFMLDQQKLDQFECYQNFLLEYNEKVNLTAITEPDAIALYHFLDSLLLLDILSLGIGDRFLDVGSGAGFPGVPIKIVRPDLDLTLMDSTNKRIVFLDALSKCLSLPYQTRHARAEDAGNDPALREQFDFVTARAVASLSVLCEYCLPFVKIGGTFAAMKAHTAKEESEAAVHAIRLLGGKLEMIQEYTLPDGSHRAVIMIKKISQTPTKYPRLSAKMAKKPL